MKQFSLLSLINFIFALLILSSPLASAQSPNYESAAIDASGHPYVTIIKAWRHGATEANRKNLLSGGGPDDSLGTTALNDEGRKQAEELGKIVVQSGPLDVIYSSDLSRALDTAKGVISAFENEGKIIEQRLSKQLREILHGKFELTDAKARNEAGAARFNEILEADAELQTPENELKDKFRFWKIHPLVTSAEVVPEEIVDVENYLLRSETRPETPYQLWQRVHNEFIRIAKKNPGATIGISTHGACLATLLDGLNPNFKGLYLAPHYNGKEIKIADEVMISAATKIENGGLFLFKYDSRNGGKLEIYDPAEDLPLSPRTDILDDLTQLPVSDEEIQITYLVRHGESTANVYFEVEGKKMRYVSGQSNPIPLTDAGRIQIAKLAEKLANRFPKHAKLVLVSSSANRTQQTAKILFEKLSKTHPHVTLAEETYEKLNERYLGVWEGQFKDEKYLEAEAPWRELSAADKFFTPEVNGSESFSQVADRALSAMSEIYDRYSDSTIIVVTSFYTINAAATQLNDAQIGLSLVAGTSLPKLNLGNGDLVLLETQKSNGFLGTLVKSHIQHNNSP